MSRLTCCRCGADLGDAEDPYRDPDCLDCIHRDAREEYEAEREETEARELAADPHALLHPSTRDDDFYGEQGDY